MSYPAEHADITSVTGNREVRPGGEVPISVGVWFDAWGDAHDGLGPIVTDPDHCFRGDLSDGVKVILEAEFAGRVISNDRYCWPVKDNSHVETVTAVAPANSGTYDFYVRVKRQSDGQVLASDSTPVTVTESAPSCPQVSCPEGFVCKDGRCVPADDGDDDDNGGGSDPVQSGLNKVVLIVGGVAAIRAFDVLGGD